MGMHKEDVAAKEEKERVEERKRRIRFFTPGAEDEKDSAAAAKMPSRRRTPCEWAMGSVNAVRCLCLVASAVFVNWVCWGTSLQNNEAVFLQQDLLNRVSVLSLLACLLFVAPLKHKRQSCKRSDKRLTHAVLTFLSTIFLPCFSRTRPANGPQLPIKSVPPRCGSSSATSSTPTTGPS